MEIIFGLDHLIRKLPCALTLGTFDGLHLGHRKIIDHLRKKADDEKLCATLVTFDPHPKLVVASKTGKPIHLLTTLDEKLDLLQKTSLDRVVVIKFDREFSRIGYEQFVKQILIDKFMARALVVGYDHAFGRNREGNFRNLQQLSEKYGFSLNKVDPYQYDGNVVSSTVIRRLLLEGNVAQAAKYLGRNYSFKGIVVPGDARGKILQFPTANLQIENHHKLIPQIGVYTVDVRVGQQMFKGMMNIGVKPTFEVHGPLSIEVHIINFHQNIYNRSITVYLKKRLRDEKKFDSKQALIAQLELDREQSLKL